MEVTRLAAVLGCLVLAGCAAGPAGSTTAGSTPSASTAASTNAPATASPSGTPATSAPSSPSAAPTGTPTGTPTCTVHPLPTRNGPRITTSRGVTGAWVCRASKLSVATPAQARALAAALALPTPPRASRTLCTDHVLANPPTWYLTMSDGRVVSPAAPVDGCFQPIQAVQLAVTAITAA